MVKQSEQEKKISEFNKLAPISGKEPSSDFYAFIKKNFESLKNMILKEKENNQKLKNIPIRIGFVYPVNVVIDETIKELCRLKYEKHDGRIEPCGGIVENRKGCPPYSPQVEVTKKKLKEATVFLILQFENLSETILQKYIHNFTVKIENYLKKNNYNILDTYCCGPCRVCTRGCSKDENCRFPEIRRFALESCGFWVNKICDLASKNTIHGDTNWAITWIKNYGLHNQTPKKFKSVSGILIKE